jgi:hypothetical protein
MESTEVKEIKNVEYGLWDELVGKSPQGTIFHSSDWLKTCAKSQDKEFRIVGYFRNGHLAAGCSFYTFKRGFFKFASSAITATPFGGVLLEEPRTDDRRKQEENLNDIMRPLRTMLENEHFDRIKLVNSPDLTDIRPFTWNGWQSVVYYTYYLGLSNFGDNISKDARWTISKAAKGGVTTEKSEDIVAFYKLYTETFVRQNLKPPLSEDFFRDIFSLLQNQKRGEMWLAKTKSGEVAAAEIIIYDDKRAYRWSAASHTELRKTGAPSLLLYEVLQDLKKKGFKEINLMAANTLQLAKFMVQFNPRLVPYYAVERKGALMRIAEYLLRRKK